MSQTIQCCSEPHQGPSCVQTASTQAQGKLVPTHMTQLHLCILKTLRQTIYKHLCSPCHCIPGKSIVAKQLQASVLTLPFIPGKRIVTKQLQASVLTLPFHPRPFHPRQNKLWQNGYKEVCSPCHFIPGAHVPGSMGSNGGHLPLHMGLNSPPLSSALLTQHLPLGQCSQASAKAKEHA